tara:strand:- start:531 stop:1580 length:1050 start_codon:yes stop_codon:yes gene_type:complete
MSQRFRITNFRRKRFILVALFSVVVATVAWIWWVESEPEQERVFRLGMRSLLTDWFPEAMQPPEGVYGLFSHDDEGRGASALSVVLIHGLDEPGGIWDELIPVLASKPVDLWELRYPNDQAIDLSADLLASQWTALGESGPVILIGHSMGGLVARDFVSRHRHPVEGSAVVSGAPVVAVFLVGTPNHGSEWARLRIWLELMDQFESNASRDFSLFSALHDGLGTAKVDLRPGSVFLDTLNARPWPSGVDVAQIGGVVMKDDRFDSSIEWLLERSPSDTSDQALEAWWDHTKEHLGDGVVTLESLAIEGFPPPVVFPATHRGLLRETIVEAGVPPAVGVIDVWVDELLAD